MKKMFALLVAFSFVLTGCGGSGDANKDGTDKKGKAEIALITDAGDINDKSFNQSAWEAVQQYSKETGTEVQYYRPQEFNTAGYATEIQNAVDNGAKVIVVPGFKFEEAMGEAQDKFPDVKFIMIDAAPKVGEEYKVGSNVYSATYLEQQPGYLAGYAAVKEGYTKLGFMGGIAVPAVINFGYGYIQGAQAAAEEEGKLAELEIKYTYTGTFSESPDIKAQAASWYHDGTEVIFSCGGGICNSIFAAAEEAGKVTIGVDSDQKDQSTSIMTSAVKGVHKTVYDALMLYKDGKFQAGAVVLDASQDYVGLSEDFSRFKNFTKEAYSDMYEKMKSGSIEVKGNDDVKKDGDPTSLAKTGVKIDFIR